MINWKLETDVDYFVLKNLENLGLKKWKDFNDQSAMSDYLKEALKWKSKTENRTGIWKPDFHLENYKIPVIIENKLGSKKLLSGNIENPKNDDNSIKNFASNGALYYANSMIESGKYKEVIAIWVAWDSEENAEIQVFYVYGKNDAFKYLPNYKNFYFLENVKTFEKFYQDIQLTEAEKHEILIKSRKDLQDYAKKLNKLMHNHNITAPQRVLYISGMLLAMQNIQDENENIFKEWLVIDDLKGSQADNFRDGKIIINHIEEFLKARNIPTEKRDLMLASFSEISKNKQRDELVELDKEVWKFLSHISSINKQIFTFIYETIYKNIDKFQGHLDIMWEMYSEFLKYALGDGKELWIVLTPPYVTKMMVKILDIDKHNKVMDLATGSAGFLISAMEEMVNNAENTTGKASTETNKKILEIKRNQLLWVELNAEMFTLAATNMILRWDGSSNIQIWSAFNRPPELYENFGADRVLLNPPFSYTENGMPFIETGLNYMQKWWLGAIIIQDSAGSGKATITNKKILKNHTLVASIKMPTDLFQPMAGVQTSIYIFEAHKPHDYDKIVKFIDFRNDGYKRTARALQEIDNPFERYEDVIKIFKNWKSARNLQAKWDLEKIYVEDFITENGNDWNFDQHQKIDTTPTLVDFKKTVSDYLSWEVSQILQKNNGEDLGKS